MGTLTTVWLAFMLILTGRVKTVPKAMVGLADWRLLSCSATLVVTISCIVSAERCPHTPLLDQLRRLQWIPNGMMADFR